MNRRQKKKQYKKIHGYNPPKNPPQELQDMTAEQIREMADAMTRAFRIGLEQAAQILSDFAAAVSKAFADMAEHYREPVAELPEPPEVTTARILAERRQTRCRNRRKGWRQSHR